MKWFSDQGVRTIRGIVKLSIVWLKRRIHGQDLRIDEEIARYLAEDKEREANYNLGVGSRGRRFPPTYPQLIYTALAHHGQVKTSSSRRSHPRSRCHTRGIAFDINTTEGKVHYTAKKTQNAAWEKTWLRKWLLDGNAARHGFHPIATEAWHWEYKP